MAYPDHLSKLREGVEEWNKWRESNRDIRPDLREADLREADLKGADLSGAILSSANLIGVDFNGAALCDANLSAVNLSVSDLSAADLSRANFRGANLLRADLSEANLKEANLRWADLSGANLSGADLTNSEAGSSRFTNLDLRNVKGLEVVTHWGPSSIGIDTIFASKGKIPEKFLRGAGVPEIFIQYMPSLTCNPLEFYSCFISYSHTYR
jgi:hypothetical protein